MNKISTIISVTIFSSLWSQNCDTIIPEIYISEKAHGIYTKKLVKAKADYDKDQSADHLIWLGRRTAYLGNYEDAIEIYSKGIDQFPKDARFYRHRGHRYISSRCFDLAIKDFKKAARLTRGKPNEVEPDGLPNALGIPTSTLQGNIFYHLGLTYYIQGKYHKARYAYEKCLNIARNPDSYVAAANWLYVIYRHLGKNKKATDLLNSIKDDMNLVENHSYHKILKLHQGKIDLIETERQIRNGDSLSNATLAFGLGNYYSIIRNESKAQEIFQQIVQGSQWSSFGYIVAESRIK
ncbi:MAG: tetratricopeptide repeat protein [Candidatus Marinimicrobia bacterium]|nr:tetratricopeptide repeat protein [Candidatus Neomarinimicrobiota bacterium]MBL7010734.1 tetratricopeptide repeat protein [Candidatus Neomarinimicrobiota bacterium]MBL7030834.1 tetratricopeptide repeat protein [Candidatus Neomarinimicrobiota bacterium]